MLGKGKEDEPLHAVAKAKIFIIVHWRGLLAVLTPIVLLPIVLPSAAPHLWCGYTLLIMAVYWMTECMPLAVTSFIPMIIFPMSDVMTTRETCSCYINDTVLMFLGSLMLAHAVEQSGLHKRLAYKTINKIGYSHVKLLFAICCVTTFMSMWITNTAATSMMVPINLAILKVFDDQKILKMYEYKNGERYASEYTACYFCCTTYSATIGGIGTLVGTGTNLVFRGLFQTAYPEAPEYLSFTKYSAFAVPYMIAMEACLFVILAYLYFGMFRPKSQAAKDAVIPQQGKEAAQKAIAEDLKKMGKITFWEIMVLILFAAAMVGFFCRSPQIFPGFGDIIADYYEKEDKKFVRDSAVSSVMSFLMLLLPSTLVIFQNWKAKYRQDLPKGRVKSVLDWTNLNNALPYSFMFLLGGGFALSTAAKETGLNDKIGEALQFLKDLPNLIVILFIIIVVTLVTNIASNVAVANVFVPIAMELAKQIKRQPLWYCITAGVSASYCFMLPVGTPGNLIVQSAANIRTTSMIKAGAGPTISTILVSWIFLSFFAPIVWPHLSGDAAWSNKTVSSQPEPPSGGGD